MRLVVSVSVGITVTPVGSYDSVPYWYWKLTRDAPVKYRLPVWVSSLYTQFRVTWIWGRLA